jgi:hypothetical protein
LIEKALPVPSAKITISFGAVLLGSLIARRLLHKLLFGRGRTIGRDRCYGHRGSCERPPSSSVVFVLCSRLPRQLFPELKVFSGRKSATNDPHLEST